LQLLESERRRAPKRSGPTGSRTSFGHPEPRTPHAPQCGPGLVELLQIESPKPEDLKQGLEAIERNARVQAQIIEDLRHEPNHVRQGPVSTSSARISTQSLRVGQTVAAPRPTRKTFISRASWIRSRRSSQATRAPPAGL
jgi:hypothetical protein